MESNTIQMKEITVKSTVHADIEHVWTIWTTPDHITKWNSPNEEWHTPKATNDLTVGGRFVSRMEAKDGSTGFDFGGQYTEIVPQKRLAYALDDGRKVTVSFEEKTNGVEVVETFEPESQNSLELQQQGWQAILDSFKKYTEEQK